jgi:hypothetical protein
MIEYDPATMSLTGEIFPLVSQNVFVVAHLDEGGKVVIDSIYPEENADMAWERTRELFEAGYSKPFAVSSVVEFPDMTRPGDISDLDNPATVL